VNCVRGLLHKLEAAYDTRIGPPGARTRNILKLATMLKYCMMHAMIGREIMKKMARDTLRAQLQLIDPVWGGVYQYPPMTIGSTAF